jgi:hypothetical protein
MRSFPRPSATLSQDVVQIQPRCPQGRHETEHDAGDERDAEREREHPSIDADLVEPRIFAEPNWPSTLTATIASASPRTPPSADNSTASVSSWRTMRSAARSDGRANGHLLLPHRRAREQKIRDVAAGDEQHQPDRAEEHVEREADVADDLVDERDDADREPAVRRIVLRVVPLHARGEDVHVGLRLLERHAGLELGEDVEVFPAPVGTGRLVERERQQEVDVLDAVHRRHDLLVEHEVGRHHADDRERVPLSVRLLPMTDGSEPNRRFQKPLLRMTTGGLPGVSSSAVNTRPPPPGAEDGKERGRHPGAVNALRHAASR